MLLQALVCFPEIHLCGGTLRLHPWSSQVFWGLKYSLIQFVFKRNLFLSWPVSADTNCMWILCWKFHKKHRNDNVPLEKVRSQLLAWASNAISNTPFILLSLVVPLTGVLPLWFVCALSDVLVKEGKAEGYSSSRFRTTRSSLFGLWACGIKNRTLDKLEEGRTQGVLN